jgi:uncharacterized protein (TIGR02265 family)
VNEKRLVFRHTTEGLFLRAFGEVLTPALRAELKGLGLSLDPPAAAVDATAFGAAFARLREAAFPGRPPAEAESLMGERFLDGYFDTVMGGLVKAMLKLLPVERALERVPQSLMSGANFIQARVLKVGPRSYEVWMSDYSTSPGFLIGVVRRMVTLSGGQQVEVAVAVERGRELVLRVGWA